MDRNTSEIFVCIDNDDAFVVKESCTLWRIDYLVSANTWERLCCLKKQWIERFEPELLP